MTPGPYRLVVFDFDGTLADSFPWFARVINDVADRYRFARIAPDEVGQPPLRCISMTYPRHILITHVSRCNCKRLAR